MIAPKIERAIVKYLTGEANTSDLDMLSEWIENPENEKLFETYVKIHFEINTVMNTPDVDNIKMELLKRIKRDKNPFRRENMKVLFRYAAVIVLIFGLGYIYQNYDTGGSSATPNDEIIIPNDDYITIQLDNGLIDTLDVEGRLELKNSNGVIVGKQNKTQLAYSNDIATEELVYNTLNVPYGKRFDVILSDGTHVYLNSGTSIKYPVKFLPNQKREVFVTGQAFFDVAKDTSRPFTVNANDLNIEVLGTQFVVSLYEEDEETSVVLVEGLVDLFKEGHSLQTQLTPGLRGVLDDRTGLISTTRVNTSIYTAWMNGVIIFRNQKFRNISKKLERLYNITIVSNNKAFSEETFNASFDNETIENILSYFKDSYHMNYTIENNIIYIN